MSCTNIIFPYEPSFSVPGGGGGSGEANTASNVGGEVEVFKIKSGTDLEFRTLEAGDGVTLTQNTNTVTIESTGSGKGWDAEEVKTSDQNVAYSGGTASDWVDISEIQMDLEADTLYEFQFNLLGSADSDAFTAVNVVFTGTANVGSWTHSQRGGETENHVVSDTALVNKNLKVGYSEELLSIVGGQIKTTSTGTLKAQVQWLDNSDGSFYIADDSSIKVRKVNTFTNFQPSVGEANTGVNLGGGSGVYASKSGVALQFKSLVAGTGITLNETATEIEVVASGGGGGLTYWTESEYTYSGKTGTKWTPDTVNTNQDVVLQPKGTGAILAHQSDGATAGGNNRGDYAIDLQLQRYSNVDVASGANSVILNGRGNKATNNDSMVLAGFINSAKSSFATVVNGAINTVDTGSTHSIIGCGANNTVDNAIKAGILSGERNNIESDYSFIGAGADNLTTGQFTAIAGGEGLYARSYGEQTIGVFNTDYTANSASTWNANDRILTVGNGTSNVARSNAFVVYKSGAVEINEAYTLPTADGTAGQVLETDGAGNVTWETPSGGGGGTTTLTNVGVGTTLVNALAGSNYPIKSIAGGGDTAISTDGSTVTVTTNTKTLTNVGGGNELVKTLASGNYPIRTIIAGSGITVTENTNDITIAATGGGGSLTYWTESEFTEGTEDYAKFTPATGTNKGVALHFKGTGNVEIGAETNSTEGTANVTIGNSNTINVNASNSHIVGAGNLIADGQYNAIFGGINHSFASTGDYNIGLGGEDNDITGSIHHGITAGGHSNGMTGASHYSGMFANNDCTIIDSFQSGIAFSELSTINTGADRSVIIAGHNTSITAGRTGAVAIGQDNTNSGNNSFTAGKGLLARSYGEMVVGAWNADYTANSTSAHNASDRAFTVGIGSADGSRANGLTVYKSGAVEVNEEYTLPTADGNDGDVVITDGAGATSFGVGNNIVLIDTQNGTGSSDTITFDSLDLSDYYKVELIGENLMSTVSTETIRMRLNGVTSNSYSYEALIDQNQVPIGQTQTTSDKNGYSQSVVTFFNPGSSTKRKNGNYLYNNFGTSIDTKLGHFFLERDLGGAEDLDPLTEIELYIDSNNFTTDTTFKLIGYRHQS